MFSASSPSIVLDAFAAAIVCPWRDKQRFRILALGISGGLGISILCYSIQYHLAQLSFECAVIYLALVVMLPGFLGIALSFVCMSRPWGRFVIAAAQVAGILLILRWPSMAIISAVAATLLQAPFWAGYHFGFAVHRSHDNHGPETALSSLLFLWAGGAGTVAGGWLLQQGHYLGALVGGAVLLFISTQLLFKRIRAETFFCLGWRFLRRHRFSARISCLNGAVGTASDFSMTAWLFAIGISPLVGGIMLAARPVLGFFVTPLIGRLVHKSGRQALLAGGTILALGWAEISIALLITKSPFAFLPGFVCLAVGSNLTGPVDVGRWYKMRSATGIVSREVCLTLGRLPTLAALMPLIYFAPRVYPFAAVGLSCLLVFGSSAKSFKKKLLPMRQHDVTSV